MTRKQHFFKIIKKHKLMKTLIITSYALVNRRVCGKNINEVLDFLTERYRTETQILSWLTAWKSLINEKIYEKKINLNNLNYHKICL